MSSRAAGGRKRLQNAPNAKAPKSPSSKGSSKGFFSRKSKKIDADPYPSPPSAHASLPDTSADQVSQMVGQSTFADNNVTLYPYERDPFQASSQQVTIPNLKKSVSASATIPSPYPPPSRPPPNHPPSARNIQHHESLPLNFPTVPPLRNHEISTLKKAVSASAAVPSAFQSSSHNKQSASPEVSRVFQASYQPPPPVQQTRPQSPHVPPSYPSSPLSSSHSSVEKSSTGPSSFRNSNRPSRPSSRPLPIYSESSSDPSEFYSASPSPYLTPPTSSLLLQPVRQSPPPLELPTYKSTQTARKNSSPSLLPIQSQNANQQRQDMLSSYPSPPTSIPRLTPSPLRLTSSPSATSLSSLPLENMRAPQAPFSESDSGSIMTRSSSPARGDYYSSSSSRGQAAPSVISYSSDSSNQRGRETQVSPSASAGFVFPGSRSVARPKAPKSGTPGIKLRGKRSKSRKAAEIDSTSPSSPESADERFRASSSASESQYTASIGLLSPISSGPSSPGYSLSSQHSQSPRQIPLRLTDSRISEAPSYSSSEPDRASARSSGSAPSAGSQGFYFPSSRSRAHPKSAPGFKFKSKSVRHARKSSNGSGEGGEKRKRFMGIPLKRKKSPAASSPLIHTLSALDLSQDDGSSVHPKSDQSISDQSWAEVSIREDEDSKAAAGKQPETRIAKSKVGSYPLDPYDSTLLDNDRQTGELLRRINSTGSPSFHNYGNFPPSTVLDLGCGQGHWVLDAAIAWKGYGTKVTGFDMVDIAKSLYPWAVKQGVADSIKFVRGNFLKNPLPFDNDSFDLVRMSNLTLCITSEGWDFVLREVHRVLTPGGRLELIDDHIFFPYGKGPIGSDTSVPITPTLEMGVPRLDISIPSSTFSTFNIADMGHINPGLGANISMEGTGDDDFYDLYGLEEEDEDDEDDGDEDFDDTATLSGQQGASNSSSSLSNPRATPRPYGRPQNFSTSSSLNSSTSLLSIDTWNQQAATCRDLEALFEHMLNHKYGINMHPSEFVLDMMKDTFGHAREVAKLHLTLAPLDSIGDMAEHNGRRAAGVSRRNSSSLSQSPGLILWPSTFLPMQKAELEIHTSKYLRMLLSCKNTLVEHAIEATDDEEIDEDSVLEALWEYENFLRQRLNPPPFKDMTIPRNASDAIGTSDAASVISVSSDSQDAMWEYQTDFRSRFAWPLERPESRAAPDSPDTPKDQNTPTPSFRSTASSPVATKNIASPASSSVVPPYSRIELTHVRTFHVYEGIKMDEVMLGSAL